MPETTPEEVYPKIQTMRLAIENAEFTVPTSVTPIKATMSFGIAGPFWCPAKSRKPGTSIRAVPHRGAAVAGGFEPASPGGNAGSTGPKP